MTTNLPYIRRKLEQGKPVDWQTYHNALLPLYDSSASNYVYLPSSELY